MNFVESLAEAEKITLKEMFDNHPIRSVRIRAHAILLSDKGFDINTITKIFEVCGQTVSGWLKRWRQLGLTGLLNKSEGGSPRKLTKDEEDEVLEMIKEQPRRIKSLLALIEEKFGEKISMSTLKRIAKKSGLIWKRVKKTLKKKRDQEKFEKVSRRIADLIERELKGEIDLYYYDESGLTLDPYVPYAWQFKGENIEVPSSHSKRINIAGFLSRKDSKFTPFVCEGSVNSDLVIEFFEYFVRFIIKKTYIFIDNASIHRSKKFISKIREWAKKGMFIVFNCPYAPELNVIEILWKKIKYEWIPFSAYESFEKLESELCNILKNIGTEFFVNFATEC
ncbi:MAG: IS630 family transposase [Gammaproteobacteria bacterium]|nr:IS630 family transposase [Gammaproteobacteria bacterium]